MDTRRNVLCGHGVHNGWHWLDVYHHGRELDRGCDGMGMLDNFYLTRYTNVFNYSHNGS